MTGGGSKADSCHVRLRLGLARMRPRLVRRDWNWNAIRRVPSRMILPREAMTDSRLLHPQLEHHYAMSSSISSGFGSPSPSLRPQSRLVVPLLVLLIPATAIGLILFPFFFFFSLVRRFIFSLSFHLHLYSLVAIRFPSSASSPSLPSLPWASSYVRLPPSLGHPPTTNH